MKKDLYLKDKYVIESDDLKFDGKNIIIPSYYASIISDYLCYVNRNDDITDADRDDYIAFVKFFEDITNYKADKGGN